MAPRLAALIDHWRSRISKPTAVGLSERDAILITYGDQVRQPGAAPLTSLAQFAGRRLKGVVSGMHILPFYPWSSDDGFSVMDYRQVDPGLGGWEDIEHLGRLFRLMFDGVINHASAQGSWFQAFLRGEAPYKDYFLTISGEPDLSNVVRPRALPLLTEFRTADGIQKVWTTFSADQVDLDYHNPEVLLEILDILLMYASRGAQFLRLDAIAYLWKEMGTPCIHLPQTHAVIRLLRQVLNQAAPHVSLITETNVAHQENLSYFGDGTDEAQMVYNFALPPLVLHTMRTGDATALSGWAAGLALPSQHTTFFNFLASHDGIGLNPVRGILTESDIQALAQQTVNHGGFISYKSNPDGSQSPYEMNINYFDALSAPASGENLQVQIDRFLAAQAIMLAVKGVPGIYFHSLFGSRGWVEGVQITGRNRSINREKLAFDELENELSQPASRRARVFGRFRKLLAYRAGSPAFHPHGSQEILDVGAGIFGVLRRSPQGNQRMICLQNITGQAQTAHAAGRRFSLAPYQVLWVEGD